MTRGGWLSRQEVSGDTPVPFLDPWPTTPNALSGSRGDLSHMSWLHAPFSTPSTIPREKRQPLGVPHLCFPPPCRLWWWQRQKRSLSWTCARCGGGEVGKSGGNAGTPLSRRQDQVHLGKVTTSPKQDPAALWAPAPLSLPLLSLQAPDAPETSTLSQLQMP